MNTTRIAFAILMISLAPAYADDNVLCVQRQLASRGADPGPLDGALGTRTTAAAQSVGGGLGLPPLTTGTAAAWCQALTPTASVTRAPTSSQTPFRRPSLCPRYVLDSDDPCF